MDKRYEILAVLPIYGDMAIQIVEKGSILVSEGYVVKFYKDYGSTWIAKDNALKNSDNFKNRDILLFCIYF